MASNSAVDPPTKQLDGSIMLAWGYDAILANGQIIRLLGNSFIE